MAPLYQKYTNCSLNPEPKQAEIAAKLLNPNKPNWHRFPHTGIGQCEETVWVSLMYIPEKVNIQEERMRKTEWGGGMNEWESAGTKGKGWRWWGEKNWRNVRKIPEGKKAVKLFIFFLQRKRKIKNLCFQLFYFIHIPSESHTHINTWLLSCYNMLASASLVRKWLVWIFMSHLVTLVETTSAAHNILDLHTHSSSASAGTLMSAYIGPNADASESERILKN